MSRRGIILALSAALVVTLGAVAWRIGRIAEVNADAAYQAGVFEIAYASTRGHVDDGELKEGHGAYDYSVVGETPSGADDIFVVVHGLNNTEVKGINRFGLARESLERNGYTGTVIGFSWDGATNWDPFGATGYRIAKHNAMANGTKLAQFLTDLHGENPDADIRVIGYSMGARLAAEAVYALANDTRFAGDVWKIASVHIVGAAIDDEHLQTNDRYGDAIEKRVEAFFNYYSPQDSKLGKYFPVLEADRAVGRHDLEEPEHKANNYFSHDVTSELPAVGETGDLDTKGETGRNHSAYLGVRTDEGKWVDDGVMDVVMQDVRERSALRR